VDVDRLERRADVFDALAAPPPCLGNVVGPVVLLAEVATN
jgi:hypothetical protein